MKRRSRKAKPASAHASARPKASRAAGRKVARPPAGNAARRRRAPGNATGAAPRDPQRLIARLDAERARAHSLYLMAVEQNRQRTDK